MYLQRIVAGFAVVTLGIFGAGTAGATSSGADVEVGLDAQGTPLLTGARYTVSVTNHGPTPCSYEAESDTLTCSFGAVAVGASVTLAPFVYYNLPPAPTTVDTTATLSTSTPADPNAANNSAADDCRYSGPAFPPVMYPPPLWC